MSIPSTAATTTTPSLRLSPLNSARFSPRISDVGQEKGNSAKLCLTGGEQGLQQRDYFEEERVCLSVLLTSEHRKVLGGRGGI